MRVVIPEAHRGCNAGESQVARERVKSVKCAGRNKSNSISLHTRAFWVRKRSALL